MKLKQAVALAICAFITAPAAFAASDCSSGEAAVNNMAQNQKQAGEMTANDLPGKAKLNLLDAQYACGEITKDAYCKDAQATAQAHLDALTSLTQIGEADLNGVIAAQKARREVKASCK